MNLVELGIIARPHGYRGEFVVKSLAGDDSALRYLKKLYIGKSTKDCKIFPVLEAAWMPSGWKIKVEGLISDTAVKELKGQSVFADRAELEAPASDEYYITDLIGATVMDFETKKKFGTFVSAESVSAGGKDFGQDRWWIDVGGEMVSVPAVKRFIESVSVADKTIWLKNLGELTDKK